jgi:hypothetical protein
MLPIRFIKREIVIGAFRLRTCQLHPLCYSLSRIGPIFKFGSPLPCSQTLCQWYSDIRLADCLAYCGIDVYSTVTGSVWRGAACAEACLKHYNERLRHCKDSGGCARGECSFGHCCPIGYTYCGEKCHAPCPADSHFSRLGCKCLADPSCRPGFTYDRLSDRCVCGRALCGADSPDCCYDKCTNLNSDIDNCGACGVRCLAPQKCINGSCNYSDSCNCGALGKRCRPDENCVNGVCQGCGGSHPCKWAGGITYCACGLECPDANHAECWRSCA